ncbi:MAG: hypothetical protein HGB09_07990 [Chlorobiaceae bacterium]|jgi:hypothetical protein|nr:hypothetical protein [Chlorobiaceae bacterium]
MKSFESITIGGTMKKRRFLWLRHVTVAALFSFLLFQSADTCAVGENPGTVNPPTIRLTRTSPTTDVTRISVRVRGGTDGCGSYAISLYVPSEGRTDRPVATASGDALAAGRNRSHTFTVRLRHSPGATHVISGFVNWGPDAQMPIRELNISDFELHHR